MSDLKFLLEIGTEEIPDWMITNALADFEKRFMSALEKFDLAAGVVCSTDATPRRLTLMASGLQAQQSDKQETLTGPPKKIAFDSDGKPTKAAEGFAKRAGIDVADIEVGTDGKLFIERSVKGRPTAEILSEVLPEVILSIYFPKAMYWGAKNGPRFIRPIRWLVALFDGTVVPFEIGDTAHASGDRFAGGRHAGGDPARAPSRASPARCRGGHPCDRTLPDHPQHRTARVHDSAARDRRRPGLGGALSLLTVPDPPEYLYGHL